MPRYIYLIRIGDETSLIVATSIKPLTQDHCTMKHLYAIGLLVSLAFAFPTTAIAQMQYFIASSFGSRFNDVNDSGLAVSGGAYFNFPTLTWTPLEPEATESVSINNNGDVAGSMWYDTTNYIFQPGVKINGTWTPIGWFPASVPEESSFSTYSISPNGVWVTGQMSHGCCDFGTFLYNTGTGVLSEIFNPDYVAVAGYVVTNDGTIGGWADDEAMGSTHRIPVFITPDFTIVQVSPTSPMTGVNAVNDINASSQMVGDIDGQPFLYDLTSNTFTTFAIPTGYETATFTSISNDGVAVGYAQKFGDFGDLLRDAIIYHPDLGAQPLLLQDILLANGVDINAPSGRMGTAIAISPDGQYIAGWDDQAPFSANGWIVYLNDLLFAGSGTRVSELEKPFISVSPNPATDLLRIVSSKDLESITLLNMSGQVVMQQAIKGAVGSVDISALSNGIYTLRATTHNASYVSKVVKR